MKPKLTPMRRAVLVTLAAWLGGGGCLLGCYAMTSAPAAEEAVQVASAHAQHATPAVDTQGHNPGHDCCPGSKPRKENSQPPAPAHHTMRCGAVTDGVIGPVARKPDAPKLVALVAPLELSVPVAGPDAPANLIPTGDSPPPGGDAYLHSFVLRI